ncbi:MAG: response regulator [Bacteroidia bacterium]
MISRLINKDITILFVEDDKVDQMAFERFVRKHGFSYRYTICDSIRASEKALSENNFDVAVVDYMIADGTGLELVEKLKNFPIIFVTGQGDQNIAVQAMKAGVYDYLVKDQNRNYLEMLPITIDNAINHKKDRERLAAIEKEVEKLMWAVSKTDNSLVIATEEGKIEWVNEGFERLTGYTMAEITGSFGDTVVKDALSGLNPKSEHFIEMMNTLKSVSYESKNYSKSGKEYWVLTTLTPIIDGEGSIKKIIAVDSEITARKEAEKRMMEAQEEALRLAKIKEEFLANMSHEIRTPMNAIMGMSQLLSETELNEKQHKYLSSIQFASDNLLALINDVLDLAKIEAEKITFEKTPFSIKDLIEKLVEIMRPKIDEKELSTIIKIDEKIPELLIGDPFRLNQIIMNLVSNSVKFTKKGSITIEAIFEKETHADVTIMCRVTDTGIGISKENITKVFEHFTQAESEITRKYGGTGLGLTIVKKLVENQGGLISVESELEKGTTFSFTLNFAKALQGQKKHFDKKSTKDLKSISGKIVLLVEDNDLNTMVATEFLEKSGLIVAHAENGIIAVNMAHEKKYDFILMDIQMPEMDGYSAAKKIKSDSSSASATTPIIAMTAHAMQGEKEKCINAGMNDYISKPLQKDKLIELLLNTG